MDWTEKESTNPSSEAFWEQSGFHSTNPFASEIEMLSGVNASTGDAVSTMTMKLFSEVMSDYIPKSEQNAEMVAATSQPNSSRASTDSSNPVDGAETTMQSNAWPPLEVTDYSFEG